jgi:hypothetical protein
MKSSICSLLAWVLPLFCISLHGQTAAPEPQSVAEKFYRYYSTAIKQNRFDDFTVRVIPGAKGMTALDTALYFSKLRQLSVFSNAFLDTEKRRLQPCVDTLAILPYKEYLKNDEPESYQVQCPFFLSYPWFYGLDFFEPTKIEFTPKTEANRAWVTLILEKGTLVTNTVFELVLEQDGWRIVAIKTP